jgi:hypothetical protein
MRYGDARRVKLRRLDAGAARKLVSAASVQVANAFERVPQRLARDDAGTYYYTDALNIPEGFTDHRLYVGKRGALRPMKLKDQVMDAAGELFITDAGTFKFSSHIPENQQCDAARSKDRGASCAFVFPEAWWIVKGKAQALTMVSDFASPQFVDTLGVYVGLPMGVPCDVF